MNPMGSLPTSFYTSQPASLHGGQTNEPTSKPPTQQMGMNNCGQSNSNMNVRQVIIDVTSTPVQTYFMTYYFSKITWIVSSTRNILKLEHLNGLKILETISSQ